MVDAYVHFDLASAYYTTSARISQGTLFQIEGAAVRGGGCAGNRVPEMDHRRRRVRRSGRWVRGCGDLPLRRRGALGLFANMYEPIWYTEKTVSAVAELVAALAALPLILLPVRLQTGRACHVVRARPE